MRPQSSQFSAEDMRGWYNRSDVLGFDDEYVLPETTSLEDAIAFIADTAGLPLTGTDDDVLPGTWTDLPLLTNAANTRATGQTAMFTSCHVPSETTST